MADVLAFETTNSFPVHPPNAIYTCWEDVCRSIQAFYQPTGSEDDIILLLEKTHQHLLDQGQQHFIDDIQACRTDQELRELARQKNHLMQRIHSHVGGNAA